MGWEHEVTGIVVFVIATFGVLSTDGLLSFMLDPFGVGARFPRNRLCRWWDRLMRWGDFSLKKSDFEVESRPDGGSGRWGRGMGWCVCAILSVLVLLQLSVFLPSRVTAAGIRTAALEPQLLLNQGALVPELSSWRVVDYEVKSRSVRSVWGENSLVWTLEKDGLRVLMSVDFYFRKWHELTVCYRASGWQLDERKVQSGANEGDWTTVEGRCHRQASRERGRLWFDQFRVTGEVLEPVGSLLAADWKERFSPRNLAVFKKGFSDGAYHDVIQVQAFVVSGEVLSEGLIDEIRAEYEGFRGMVYEVLLDGGEDG